MTVVSISAMNVQGVEDIKITLEQVKVVAVTCLGISSPLLANTRFDVCIMDEAGQTTLPVCLFLSYIFQPTCDTYYYCSSLFKIYI